MDATTGPVVVERAEQPYVYMRRTVRAESFGEVADRLPELAGWLAARGIEAAGPPFFRFNTVDPAGVAEVEAAVPVMSPPEPEGDVGVALLPAGRYAALSLTGPPGLRPEAAARLREWADERGLEWDMREVGGVERWGCRIEAYRTGGRGEAGPPEREVEMAFRLADRPSNP